MNLINDDWYQYSLIGSLRGSLASWGKSSWLLKKGEILGAILIALLLGLAPFVSTSTIGIILLGIGCFWLLLTITEEQKFSSGWIPRLVLLYWAIATVATAFSPVKSAALDGWIKLTLYLLFFALCERILRYRWLRSCLITLLLNVSLIVSVYGVRQKIFGARQLATWNDPTSPLANQTRVYSYLDNPNLLAGYLLAAIALSLGGIFIWKSWLSKTLALTIFVVDSACLYFTDSRGGWLALAGLLGTFAALVYYRYYRYFPGFWRYWLLPLVIGAMAVIGAIAFVKIETFRLRILSIFAGREDSSNNFRLNVWEAVFQMIRDYPIIGIGPGNRAFEQIYPLYMRPNYTSLGAYSIYLEITVEMGLIGISCFLSLVGVTFYRALVNLQQLIKSKQVEGFWLISALSGLVGLLIQGIADVIWFRPQVNTLWWFLVALIASFDYVNKSDKNAAFYS